MKGPLPLFGAASMLMLAGLAIGAGGSSPLVIGLAFGLTSFALWLLVDRDRQIAYLAATEMLDLLKRPTSLGEGSAPR